MRGIHTCCPEAPSVININQNIVQLDGETSYFVDETFPGTAAQSQRITLTHTPYAAASVLLSLNSGVQRPVTDYIVVGKEVRLMFVPDTSDMLHFRYFATDSGAMVVPGGSELPTGFMMGFSGSPIPDGWLVMSTDTVVSETLYPSLYGFLTNNMHLVEATVGVNDDYQLKTLLTPYYDGTTMVSGSTIIKF